MFIVLHFKRESLPRRILEFARENYLCLDQVWSNLRSVAPRGLLYKPRESSTLHFSFYMVHGTMNSILCLMVLMGAILLFIIRIETILVKF